jgi:hypothetical protein
LIPRSARRLEAGVPIHAQERRLPGGWPGGFQPPRAQRHADRS